MTRRELAEKVNGAEANLRAALERLELAVAELEKAEADNTAHVRLYDARRADVLRAKGADQRLAAVEAFELALAGMPGVRVRLQRARAERGTAHALHEKRIEEARVALAALEKVLPPEAP